MRILIYEPDCSGHHLHFVRHMVEAFQQLPVEITVALPQGAADREEFTAHLSGLAGNVTWDCFIGPAPKAPLAKARYHGSSLRQSIARARPDRLYVPYADGLSQILGLWRTLGMPVLPPNVKSEALLMRGSFAYPQADWRQRLRSRASWKIAMRAPWDIIHLLDPIVYEAADEAEKQSGRVRLIPEPIESSQPCERSAARQFLHVPLHGRYVSCVGVLDERKGCDRLIRSFAAASLAPGDRLLLAGKHQPTIRELLATEPFARLVREGRIITIDRTLSMDEMLKVLAASDVIALLYPRHIGSASIALRAAAAERPVLASDFGWLGTMVPRFNLGWCTPVEDMQHLAKALVQALDRGPTFVPTPTTQQLVTFNSISNFQAHWTASLRTALGLSPSSAQLAAGRRSHGSLCET